MSTLRALSRSSVGRKLTMAVSGAFLVLFVLLHMLGNLKAFQGAESFNHYAEYLREIGTPVLPASGFLWVQRVALILLVGVHIWAAWTPASDSRAARTVGYKKAESLALTYASRTMRWGGVIIAAFVGYHLLHMTAGTVHPEFVAHDAYGNLVRGLSVPWVALAYVVAVTMLALHLQHGVWSGFQTLGVAGPRVDRWKRAFATGLAAVIWGGYVLVPLAVLAGVIR